jgi:hypothetical protein
MLKIILQDPRYLPPFNERARDLRIQNKPLWLIQRDVLSRFTGEEIEIPAGTSIPEFQGPAVVELVFRSRIWHSENTHYPSLLHIKGRMIVI